MSKQRKKVYKTSSRLKKRSTPLQFFTFSWPKTLFATGVLLLTISLLYHLHELSKLSFYQQNLPATVHLMSRPTEIRVKSLDLDLPVLETVIANDTWQIADNGISHLTTSARPGENGTIILYGHNTNERFGPLLLIHLGDTITLTSADNKTHIYVVKKLSTVKPSDTKILTSQIGPTLLLYTCTSFADLERFVVIAKPN